MREYFANLLFSKLGTKEDLYLLGDRLNLLPNEPINHFGRRDLAREICANAFDNCDEKKLQLLSILEQYFGEKEEIHKSLEIARDTVAGSLRKSFGNTVYYRSKLEGALIRDQIVCWGLSMAVSIVFSRTKISKPLPGRMLSEFIFFSDEKKALDVLLICHAVLTDETFVKANEMRNIQDSLSSFGNSSSEEEKLLAADRLIELFVRYFHYRYLCAAESCEAESYRDGVKKRIPLDSDEEAAAELYSASIDGRKMRFRVDEEKGLLLELQLPDQPETGITITNDRQKEAICRDLYFHLNTPSKEKNAQPLYRELYKDIGDRAERSVNSETYFIVSKDFELELGSSSTYDRILRYLRYFKLANVETLELDTYRTIKNILINHEQYKSRKRGTE